MFYTSMLGFVKMGTLMLSENYQGTGTYWSVLSWLNILFWVLIDFWVVICSFSSLVYLAGGFAACCICIFVLLLHFLPANFLSVMMSCSWHSFFCCQLSSLFKLAMRYTSNVFFTIGIETHIIQWMYLMVQMLRWCLNTKCFLPVHFLSVCNWDCLFSAPFFFCCQCHPQAKCIDVNSIIQSIYFMVNI